MKNISAPSFNPGRMLSSKQNTKVDLKQAFVEMEGALLSFHSVHNNWHCHKVGSDIRCKKKQKMGIEDDQ